MAISSAGVGSGLNVQSIVSQLVAVESQPVKLLQAKGSTLQNKMSVFGQIKSELASLQDAASTLRSASTWDAKSLTSSNSTAVTGTATSAAAVGSFSVDVENLVSTQSATLQVASNYAAPEAFTLNIQLGTRDKTTDAFAAGTASAVPITVKAGDKLSDIAANINAQSGVGVVATVITTATGQQLALRGTTAGANSGFQITSSDGPNNIADGLIQTTDSGATFTKAGTWTTTQYAADAKAKIDGIEVTSSTNTITGVVAGVTLNLLAPTTSAAAITVDTDKAGIKSKIQAFEDAYNKVYADLKTQTAYNAATKTGGPLLGDNTAIGLMSMLRNLASAIGPAGSGSLSRLSDLGLEIQSDGSFQTNSTKLDAALQTPANVKNFFSASTGTASSDGIAKRMYDFVFGALSVGGTVNTHSNAFQKAIDQNNANIDKFNLHIDAYQKQLLAQYNALDTNMAKLNSLSSYVSQQITTWNKSG